MKSLACCAACCVAALLLAPAQAALAKVPAGASLHKPTTDAQDHPAEVVKAVQPRYPAGDLREGGTGCVRLVFRIDPDGKASHVEVLSAFPDPKSTTNHYVYVSKRALAESTFKPAVKDGKAVSAETAFTYAFAIASDKEMEATDQWLCEVPLFMATPINIYRANASKATSKADSGATPESEQPKATLDQTVQTGKRPVTVTAEFCIDPQGRLANVTLDGGDRLDRQAALIALDSLHYRGRKLKADGSSSANMIWTCGLHRDVEFYSQDREGVVGRIDDAGFNELISVPADPKLLASSGQAMQIKVPLNAALPPKAVVTVEFCIDRDGSTSDRQIVEAKPPKLFDDMMLQYVAGWRFAPQDLRMCNVYRTLQFAIPKPRAAQSR